MKNKVKRGFNFNCGNKTHTKVKKFLRVKNMGYIWRTVITPIKKTIVINFIKNLKMKVAQFSNRKIKNQLEKDVFELKENNRAVGHRAI